MDKRQLVKQVNENAAKVASPPPPAPAKANSPRQPKPKTPITSGKTAAIWLDEVDRAVLREVTVLAVNMGLKPSDSVIVKTALRMLPRNPQMIEQMREVMERDGRRLRGHKAAQKQAE
jgi:hypothetical protein